MRRIVIAIFAAACGAAACTVPTATKPPALGPGWPDAGTPPATSAAHEIRSWRDARQIGPVAL